MEEQESIVGGVGEDLAGGLAALAAAELDHLAEETEMRLVGDEREHDQVGVEAVQAVCLVGVPTGFAARPSDVLHDLVLALAANLVAGEDHGGSLPERVLGLFLEDVEAEVLGEARHERGAGGDAVGVEGLAGGLGLALRGSLRARLLRLERGSETTRTLLVHLRAGRDAVDGHVQQAARTNHAEDVIEVREHLGHLRGVVSGDWGGGERQRGVVWDPPTRRERRKGRRACATTVGDRGRDRSSFPARRFFAPIGEGNRTISSSVMRVLTSVPAPCEQLWMTPFMSR